METLQHFFYTYLLDLFHILLDIHTGIENLAKKTHVDTPTVYLILHFSLGLLGVSIYRYIAEGPANPFKGAGIERDMFWFILFTGLAGLIMSVIAAGDNLLSKKNLSKKNKLSKNQTSKALTPEKQNLSYLAPELTEETAKKIRRLL